MQRKFKEKYDKKNIKVPAQILVWTIVNVDNITDLSDEHIITMANAQENWRVSRHEHA